MNQSPYSAIVFIGVIGNIVYNGDWFAVFLVAIVATADNGEICKTFLLLYFNPIFLSVNKTVFITLRWWDT